MAGIALTPSRVIDPIMAILIAYVAIENIVTQELKPWRVALVFGFGLLHGMRFAGFLRGLGLPRGELLNAVLTFNLGVEGAQLTVVALAALAIVGYRHQSWYHRLIVVPASLAIATASVYLTIARAVR